MATTDNKSSLRLVGIAGDSVLLLTGYVRCLGRYGGSGKKGTQTA